MSTIVVLPRGAVSENTHRSSDCRVFENWGRNDASCCREKGILRELCLWSCFDQNVRCWNVMVLALTGILLHKCSIFWSVPKKQTSKPCEHQIQMFKFKIQYVWDMTLTDFAFTWVPWTSHWLKLLSMLCWYVRRSSCPAVHSARPHSREWLEKPSGKLYWGRHTGKG